MSTTVLNIPQAIEITDKIDAILSVTAQYSQEAEVKTCLDTVWEFNYNLRTFLYTINLSTTAPTPSTCPSIEPSGVTIGDRIKIARENLGMSEDDLAEKLDIHPGDVLTWEDNAGQPLAGMIIPLANALKCDPMWLLTENATHQDLPDTDNGEHLYRHASQQAGDVSHEAPQR
ncbi:TPA: helix-turn-helix domain-containing protein [Salmonella enterica]